MIHEVFARQSSGIGQAGGAVLLGVDDSGAIVGSTRDADRLEVTSPGRLPNTVTTEGMRRGLRAIKPWCMLCAITPMWRPGACAPTTARRPN